MGNIDIFELKLGDELFSWNSLTGVVDRVAFLSREKRSIYVRDAGGQKERIEVAYGHIRYGEALYALSHDEAVARAITLSDDRVERLEAELQNAREKRARLDAYRFQVSPS